MNKILFFTTAGLILLAPSLAQAESLPFDEDTWETRGTVEFAEFKGKRAAFLQNGLLLLKDRTFQDGIIEFDISFPEIRGFTGVNFRVQDRENYENFYFRPHQGGNEDANQYTPSFKGLTGWQIYYGPQYSTPVEYNYENWMHVKVLVKGDEAEFYLDSEEPFLHVDDLLQDNVAGQVSFSSFLVGTYLANIEVTETSDFDFKGTAVDHEPWPDNLVQTFEVAVGAVALVDPSRPLDKSLLEGRVWKNLEVERNGIANLARINGTSEATPTTLVRLRVQSAADQIKVLKFGYSDKVSVFLNGQPVAGGDNTYMTRDYRYLGTVGLFDEVYLPLKAGENEIIFAVTEAFGGWAVMAQFPDMGGIEILP